MKNAVLSIFLTISCGMLFGQTMSSKSNYNKFSVEYGFGSHALAFPVGGNLYNLAITHHELGGRYMFGERFGVMLDVGFDNFRYPKKGVDFKDRKGTRYLRVSLQGVMNLGHIIHLNDLHHRLGLLVHAGGGYSNLWGDFNNEGRKHDQMFNFIGGITPQLKLTERWAIKADISLIAHILQDRGFNEMGKRTGKKIKKPKANDYDLQTPAGIDNYVNDKIEYELNREMNELKRPVRALGFGSFLNVSIGITYYIGSKQKHSDWVLPNSGVAVSKKPRY